MLLEFLEGPASPQVIAVSLSRVHITHELDRDPALLFSI